MSKAAAGDEDERPKIKNTPAQDLEAARQLQKKIDLSFQKVSESSFKKYEQELQNKNTYWTTTKYPDVNSKDLSEDQKKTIAKFSGKLDKNMVEGYYCPKCTSKSYPCYHDHETPQIKEKFHNLTSISNYINVTSTDSSGNNYKKHKLVNYGLFLNS